MNALLSSPAALVVDYVTSVMDRTQHRNKILSDLIESTRDCGEIAAFARHTAARCAEAPSEAVAILQRTQRRIDAERAKLTTQGVLQTDIDTAHAAFGRAAEQLEGN